MKKFIFALATTALMLNIAATTNAAERILPETNKISAQMHLEVIGVGDSQQPVWIADNPNLYSKQTVAADTYETRINDQSGALETIKNGKVINSYTPFNISEHFNYEN